jgi:hypothetical protein
MRLREWTYATKQDVKHKHGIYVLCSNRPIEKLFAKDTYGVLYIGEAQTRTLKDRLHLRCDRTFEHHCLWERLDFVDSKGNLLFYKLGGQLSSAKPRLFYAYISDSEIETKLLFAHFKKYGQLPPFNRKLKKGIIRISNRLYKNFEKELKLALNRS